MNLDLRLTGSFVFHPTTRSGKRDAKQQSRPRRQPGRLTENLETLISNDGTNEPLINGSNPELSSSKTGTNSVQRRNALLASSYDGGDPEGPLEIFSSDSLLWTPPNLRHARRRPAALTLLLRGAIPAIRFCSLEQTRSGAYRPGAGCIITFRELGEQIIPRFWSLLEEHPELAWDVDPYEASHAK